MNAFYVRSIAITGFLILSTLYGNAQTETSEKSPDTTYALCGDTLFTNKDFTIYKGQALIIGSGAGERGWYNAVSFRSGASWPLLFLQKTEMENNLEYQLDPSVREKDKVRDSLYPGDTLIVTKIKKYGKKRRGYWYNVSLVQKQGLLSLHYTCNIINAIRSKEMLLPTE
jgi:hypothetical protein